MGACGGSHVLSALRLRTGGNRWLPGPPPDRDGTQMAPPAETGAAGRSALYAGTQLCSPLR